MSEPTEAPPASDPRETRPGFIPPAVLGPLVQEITRQLNEPNHVLIRKIVLVVGVERARALLQQAVAIEAAGGQMTLDGTRRKTPGGLFISLARAQATSTQERKRLLDFRPKPKRTRTPANGQPRAEPAAPVDAPSQQTPPAPSPAPKQAKPKPAPLPAPTWEETKQLAAHALHTPGEATTVRLLLIGTPSQVVPQPTCVVVVMQGQEPPALPTGLPTPPATSAMTWAVFIATKQWDKVKASITLHPADQLIIEGYPLLDPKRGAGVVLATSCRSMLMEKAQREAKQRS